MTTPLSIEDVDFNDNAAMDAFHEAWIAGWRGMKNLVIAFEESLLQHIDGSQVFDNSGPSCSPRPAFKVANGRVWRVAGEIPTLRASMAR